MTFSEVSVFFVVNSLLPQGRGCRHPRRRHGAGDAGPRTDTRAEGKSGGTTRWNAGADTHATKPFPWRPAPDTCSSDPEPRTLTFVPETWHCLCGRAVLTFIPLCGISYRVVLIESVAFTRRLRELAGHSAEDVLRAIQDDL